MRAARTIPPEYGIGGLTAYGTLLGPYSYDWMQRELVRPFYFTDNERLPQYATEAVLRRRVGRACRASRRSMAGAPRTSARTTAASRSSSPSATAAAAGRCAPTTWWAATAAARWCATRAGITQSLSDHDRLMVLLVFRSPGLHELLERFPGKSFYNVLHPDARGLLEVLRPRRPRQHLVLPRAGARRARRSDNFDFRRLVCTRRSAPTSTSSSSTSASGSCASPSPTPTAAAASSSPATPPTAIRPTAATASTPGSRTRATSAGSSPPRCRAGPGRGLLDSYDAERRPVFCSTARDFIEKAIAADRTFLAAFDPARDKAAFERAWSGARLGRTLGGASLRAQLRGLADRVRRPRRGAAARSARTPSPPAPAIIWPRSRSPSGRNVFEELGDGFTLLCLDDDDSACRAFTAAADKLDVPLKILRDSRAGARERYEAAYVLVRPDHFVAWAGDDPSPNPEPILRKSIGATL